MSRVARADQDDAGLHQLLRFDLLSVAVAVAVMLATYATVVRTGWLLVLSLLVAAAGGVMALGLRPLQRGQLEGTVRWLAIANWAIALIVSAIAPFDWPLMMLVALLPAVLAVPYVRGRRLRWYVIVSVAVATAVSVLGLLQDVTGFEEELPDWLPPAIVIVFVPFPAWIVVQLALQNSARLQASRRRLVEATDQERRRMERDLHDGAQQRLVALGVRLRIAENLCRTDPERAATTIAGLREEVRAAQVELRNLAHGVYPAVLTQHGLGEALRAAADRCAVPVDVAADRVGRFEPSVESAVYFCCVEALQNAAKHAGPEARARVELAVDGGELCFSIADDGVGFEVSGPTAGTGLDSLRDRLGAAGGELVVRSAPGRGTKVSGRLPADGGRGRSR